MTPNENQNSAYGDNPYGKTPASNDNPYGQNPTGQPAPPQSPYSQAPQAQQWPGQNPQQAPQVSSPYAAPQGQQWPQQAPQGQQWTQQAGYPMPAGYPSEAQTLAKHSLIMAIIGFFIFGVILGPIALVKAYKARALGNPAKGAFIMSWVTTIASYLLFIYNIANLLNN